MPHLQCSIQLQYTRSTAAMADGQTPWQIDHAQKVDHALDELTGSMTPNWEMLHASHAEGAKSEPHPILQTTRNGWANDSTEGRGTQGSVVDPRSAVQAKLWAEERAKLCKATLTTRDAALAKSFVVRGAASGTLNERAYGIRRTPPRPSNPDFAEASALCVAPLLYQLASP
jgi:hypothetical protein